MNAAVHTAGGDIEHLMMAVVPVAVSIVVLDARMTSVEAVTGS